MGPYAGTPFSFYFSYEFSPLSLFPEFLQLLYMLVHELVYVIYLLRLRLSLDDPVFQCYREITAATFHLDMRRIVVKGI